ncbi:hypothetical protein [Hymenobacter sp. DG01]|uniref:hypothetical protein n=1 Tax=Hymenobacter sp. DG01 TaxID=2584940 RepID=UPI001122ED5A|nr:hypothetical protein [Hymenobacter sp. DG01]
MKRPFFLLLAGMLVLNGCSSDASTTSSDTEYSSSTDDESDESDESGETAEASTSSYSSSGSGNVEYYNPNTGTQSTYTLDVEHDSNGDVERINFDNGGWIDDSHIVDQTHNGDGTITVTTDRGAEYTVDESSDYESDSDEDSDSE